MKTKCSVSDCESTAKRRVLISIDGKPAKKMLVCKIHKDCAEPKTKVIFRIWPLRAAKSLPFSRVTLEQMTLGHVPAISIPGSIRPVVRLATPTEYASLKRELENYGPPDAHYVLDIRKRMTYADYLERVKQLAR